MSDSTWVDSPSDRETDAEGLVIPTPEEIAEQTSHYDGPEHGENEPEEAK
jgi:hypothetical protein